MRASILLLLLSGILSYADEPFAGRWEGVAQIPDAELTLVVDLAQDNAKAWSGSIIIPGLGLKGAVLTDVTVKNGEATFAAKSGGGLEVKFDGRLSADGTLSGEFTQAGNHAAYSLKKVGPAQVESPPRSTPIAKETEGEWKGDYEMFGYARHVTIKLVNREGGGTADFVIVGKKVNHLPVDLVRQEGDLLTVESHETGISVEGRLDKKTNEIRGTLIQGSIELPLLLKHSS